MTDCLITYPFSSVIRGIGRVEGSSFRGSAKYESCSLSDSLSYDDYQQGVQVQEANPYVPLHLRPVLVVLR